MATETVTQAPDALAKLHRASCLVGVKHVVRDIRDEVLPGETLKAAEEMILSAMDAIRGEEA